MTDTTSTSPAAPTGYTVAAAVHDWLAYGLNTCDQATVTKLSILAKTHVIPALGARKLRALTAEEVDRWLTAESESVSPRTLQDIRSILKHAITHAERLRGGTGTPGWGCERCGAAFFGPAPDDALCAGCRGDS